MQTSSSQDPQHCLPENHKHSTDTIQRLNSSFQNEPLIMQGRLSPRPPPPAPYVTDAVDAASPLHPRASNPGPSRQAQEQPHAALSASDLTSIPNRPNHDFFHQRRNIRTRRYNQDRARDDEIPHPLFAAEQLTDVWTEIDHLHTALNTHIQALNLHTQAILQTQSHAVQNDQALRATQSLTLQNQRHILQQAERGMQQLDHLVNLSTGLTNSSRQVGEVIEWAGELQREAAERDEEVSEMGEHLQALEREVGGLRRATTIGRMPGRRVVRGAANAARIWDA